MGDVGVVAEPVEQRGGQLLVAEDLDPLGEREVRGDDCGAHLVAVGQQVGEQFAAGQLEGHEPMTPDDFHLTAGWGLFGVSRAVMPRQSKLERREDMVDIYLNNNAYWRDSPIEV